MKFRQFTEKAPISTPSLREADLLAAPSAAANGTPPSRGQTIHSPGQGTPPGPQAGTDQPAGDGHPLGSGREPDAMDEQIRQAGVLAAQLLKVLTGLPHPWNKRFYMFLRPLQGLVAKVKEVS